MAQWTNISKPKCELANQNSILMKGGKLCDFELFKMRSETHVNYCIIM